MKNLFAMLFVLLSVTLFAQQNSGTEEYRYFAQVMLNDISTEQVSNLTEELTDNPNVFVFRYDAITNGLLIITEPVVDFNEETVRIWLAENSQNIECLNVGIKNLDKQYAFNSNFCSNLNNQ